MGRQRTGGLQGILLLASPVPDAAPRMRAGERPRPGRRESTACQEWLCDPLAPSPAWLSANVVLWPVHVDSQPLSASRPPDFGQSYLLSLKTGLGRSEGWLGSIAVPKTGARDSGFHRSTDLTFMGTGGRLVFLGELILPSFFQFTFVEA